MPNLLAHRTPSAPTRGAHESPEPQRAVDRSVIGPVLVVVLVPVLVVVELLLFAWPAARLAPRDLPLGVYGASGARLATTVSDAMPDAFDITRYATAGDAERAIREREVYGAVSVTGTSVVVLTASAASVPVAQQLGELGRALGARAGVEPDRVLVRDVVATSPDDPRGTVFTNVLLPLIISSIALGAVVTLLLGRHVRARYRVGVLILASGAAALGAVLVAQGYLGALPGSHLATWAAAGLTVLASSAVVAGASARLGAPGIGLGALLLVLVGNPFSGVASAPELLPEPAGVIGGLLPPGAGVQLLRSTAYFDGHGAAGPLAVLLGWTVLGLTAVLLPRSRRAPRTVGGAHEAG